MADEAADRHAKALELHLAGASYDAIAKAVGYAGRSGAYKAVQEALKAQQSRPMDDELLLSELARLDAMLTGLWPKARRGDVQAVDRVLKIGERRSALLAMSSGNEPEKAGTAVDELKRRRESQGLPDATGKTRTARPTVRR